MRSRLLFFLLLLPLFSCAQDTAQYQLKENFKREIIINYKRFRVYNNWVTGGIVAGYNSQNPHTQRGFDAGFNFHIHKTYLHLGVLFTGDDFGLWNNYLYQVCWVPYRKETMKHNIALIAGYSYSNGYRYIDAPDIYSPVAYGASGFYAEAQWTRKIYYDAGVGFNAFINIDKQNFIAGIGADIYLSGAFKGYVRGHEPKHMVE